MSELSTQRWLARINALPAGFRHPQAHAAFKSVVVDQPSGTHCLSVGGGPRVVHPRLTNLNICPFANVHVVGTAYELPFASSSIDAVYCEAVLEHLEQPECAAAEMRRVLRPGGQLFAATPFLQPYHGHPDHF
jgi:SAM-dependent methyltransferase